MKAKLVLTFGLFFSFFATNFLQANEIITVHDPVGVYDFVVTDIPDQPDVKGTMTVARKDGKVTVKFSSSAGDADLTNVKLDGHNLTGKLDMQGIVLNLKGKFTETGFEGQWNTEFGAIGITATKK